MSESLPVPPATKKTLIGAFFLVLGVGAVNAFLLHRIDIAIGACFVAVIILVGAVIGARGHVAWFVDIGVVLAGVVAQALSVYSTFAHPNEGPGVAILTVVAVNHLFLFLVALAATCPRQAGVIVVSSVASLAVALHVSPLNISTSFRQIMIVTGWSFLVPSILIAISYMRSRAAQYRAAQSEKTFLDSIGHEMRTPLTTILGLTRLARESAAVGNTDAYLSKITAAGEHLQAVMETLFLTSSYRSGSRTMTLESIHVHEFVTALEQRVSRLVHDTGLTLSSGPRAATGCTIVADRELLMQVCTALAIARLRQAVAGDSMVVIATCLNDGILIGIDSSHETEALTTELSQVENPPPTRAVHWSCDDSEAVLFVIDSLLREMNGQVVIRDTGGGRGIPLIRVPRSAGGSCDDDAGTESEAEAQQIGERTILYIEDNLGNQNLMRAIFETMDDWHLMISGTAEAGIDLSRTSQPDIILMDINLPGMSGCDALSVLKRDPLTSRIPILAVTATRRPCLDAENSGARFDAIVLKPFSRDELINPIVHALSER